MKRYRYNVGTPDAMNKDASKLVNKKSNPKYLGWQNVIASMKDYYKGDTSDYEWQ